MELIFAELFSTVIKLFALLTPPAVLSAFLGGTQNYGSRRKRRTPFASVRAFCSFSPPWPS